MLPKLLRLLYANRIENGTPLGGIGCGDRSTAAAALAVLTGNLLSGLPALSCGAGFWWSALVALFLWSLAWPAAVAVITIALLAASMMRFRKGPPTPEQDQKLERYATRAVEQPSGSSHHAGCGRVWRVRQPHPRRRRPANPCRWPTRSRDAGGHARAPGNATHLPRSGSRRVEHHWTAEAYGPSLDYLGPGVEFNFDRGKREHFTLVIDEPPATGAVAGTTYFELTYQIKGA